MEDMCILVVDDQEDNRKKLIKGLTRHGLPGGKIFEAPSGEEAEKLVQAKPGFFDVAVIDQRLEQGAMDGIETTRRICSRERDIFPIIFTNMPSDNPTTIEFHRAKAYEAGAYRYMYRDGSSDDVIKVKDFVAEIRELRQLSERIRRFYDAQKWAPSLLNQLDIMVALIDRGFKVWYLNAAHKRFQNIRDLPRSDCSRAFLKSDEPPPCKGCIVQQTFLDGKNHERIYLHPVDKHAQKIKWVYAWTQPMPDQNGNPILLEDGNPIAVLESSQDLTDSGRLKTMPVKERMSHITRALNERYNGFDRVRIYEANPEGDRLTLITSIGYTQTIKSVILEVLDFPVLKQSIKHLKKTGEGCFHHLPNNDDPICRGELLEKFIHWPIMKGELLVGLLSVSSVKGGRPCTEDGLDILAGYAQEALKALESRQKDYPIPEVEKIMSEIDNLVIRKETPESRLHALIEEVYRLTDSDGVNIRYREENVARLLPIGKGAIYEQVPRELPFTSRTYPSVRVIISGREEINGNASRDPQVIEFRGSLPAEAAKALGEMDSYCFEPLIFQDRCIGRLALYKKEKLHYNEKYVVIARMIANRMALALHDYLVNIERMVKDYAFESSINALAFTDLDGNITYVNPCFLQLLGYGNEREVHGKHFREFFADNRVALKVLRTLVDTGSWRGELLARRKNSSLFDAQLSASLVKDRTGKSIGGMASFIDITQRKQLEKIQGAIYRISETASSVKNLNQLYPKIYEIIRDLIPAKNFYIALYDEKKQTIRFPYFIDQEDPPPQPRKREKGMTEYVLRTGEPILAPPGVCEELKDRGEIEDLGTPSIDWLGVPLKTTDNKTIGVLVVQTYEEGLRYTEEDKDMLVFVSTQIAMVIQRKQAEDQMKKSLKEKEALLKEIHHRVKNNLAIIYELLELQSDSLKEPKLQDFFKSSKNRIKSMALIHETLFQSEDIARIDSHFYINSLVDHLESAFGGSDNNIHSNVQVENIPLSIDTAVPCGLIINELVTNAFKHAFVKRREGDIHIRFFKEKNNSITLVVSDNGIGLPQGLDIREASSLGLQLVDILVRQLDASISIEQRNGTRFEITFFEETNA